MERLLILRIEQVHVNKINWYIKISYQNQIQNVIWDFVTSGNLKIQNIIGCHLFYQWREKLSTGHGSMSFDYNLNEIVKIFS